MPFTYGPTVTLVQRTVSGKDEYGNDTYSEVQTDIPNCVFVPSSSTEIIQFTDQVATSVTVFVPYGTDVDYLDAVIVGGIRYEVQGEPSVWMSPFSGHTSPIQINANRVLGVSV